LDDRDDDDDDSDIYDDHDDDNDDDDNDDNDSDDDDDDNNGCDIYSNRLNQKGYKMKSMVRTHKRYSPAITQVKYIYVYLYVKIGTILMVKIV
jgi:hypothetical protein